MSSSTTTVRSTTDKSRIGYWLYSLSLTSRVGSTSTREYTRVVVQKYFEILDKRIPSDICTGASTILRNNMGEILCPIGICHRLDWTMNIFRIGFRPFFHLCLIRVTHRKIPGQVRVMLFLFL
jgi:hypothetical protein